MKLLALGHLCKNWWPVLASSVWVCEDIERWLGEVVWVWRLPETQETVFYEAVETGVDGWVVTVAKDWGVTGSREFWFYGGLAGLGERCWVGFLAGG